MKGQTLPRGRGDGRVAVGKVGLGAGLQEELSLVADEKRVPLIMEPSLILLNLLITNVM